MYPLQIMQFQNALVIALGGGGTEMLINNINIYYFKTKLYLLNI